MRHMIRIDLLHFSDLLGFACMVRDRVMRVRHADLRICDATELPAEHQRDDTR